MDLFLFSIRGIPDLKPEKYGSSIRLVYIPAGIGTSAKEISRPGTSVTIAPMTFVSCILWFSEAFRDVKMFEVYLNGG